MLFHPNSQDPVPLVGREAYQVDIRAQKTQPRILQTQSVRGLTLGFLEEYLCHPDLLGQQTGETDLQK